MHKELQKAVYGAQGSEFERTAGVYLGRAWLFGLAAIIMATAATLMAFRAVSGPWPLDVATIFALLSSGFSAAAAALLLILKCQGLRAFPCCLVVVEHNVRYGDGGGVNAAGRAKREAVRLEAAGLFERGISAVEVARTLEVSTKSVYQWRRAWEAGGPDALASRGRRARTRSWTMRSDRRWSRHWRPAPKPQGWDRTSGGRCCGCAS
ncbi:hypothetical protein GCM10029992_37240 [Glycomyces albus]